MTPYLIQETLQQKCYTRTQSTSSDTVLVSQPGLNPYNTQSLHWVTIQSFPMFTHLENVSRSKSHDV